MSDKVKPRQQRTPKRHRNIVAREMIISQGGKGGPMRDRRDRRPKDARNIRDWDLDS